MTETTSRRGYPTAEINWEARCGQLVTDGIKTANQHRIRMQEKNVELQQARQQIAELEKQVATLQPLADKAQSARDDANEYMRKADAEVRRYRTETSGYKTALARGQRGVIEDVVTWLQNRAAQMPEVKSGDEIGVDTRP